MRPIFLIAFALCFSACFAQKFLSVKPTRGGYNQIDLENPPQGFLDTLEVLDTYLFEACGIKGDVKINGIKRAAFQIVSGTNYEIVFNVDNYESNVLSVKVFQSLADNETEAIQYEINSCQ